MSILEEINEKFPVRRSRAQKSAFRKWAVGKMTELGFKPHVEENGSHCNVVAGSPEGARIVFTAHYDTASCIGLPNLLIPRNLPVHLLWQLVQIAALLLISLLGGVAVAMATRQPILGNLGFFGVFVLLMLLMLYGPANRNNVNDNTSGIAALLEAMALIPQEDRGKAAFILFDNEEKGRAGSKAYAKDHLQVQHTRLIVNVDCVGVGEHFVVSVPRLAKTMDEYTLLGHMLTDEPGRAVHLYNAATTRSNSDHRSFNCGVGISAHEVAPGVGFYTGAIHTRRDTEADEENIEFLARAFSRCVVGLHEAS